MNRSIRKKLARGKCKNRYRLRDIEWEDQSHPMFSARNIKYDLADKTRGLACGGIGAIHTLARQSGLIDAIDLADFTAFQRCFSGRNFPADPACAR